MTEQNQNPSNDILPQDPQEAVKMMIAISEELTGMINAESNAVAMNDAMTYTIAEGAKEPLLQRYERAAKEFQGRISQLRHNVPVPLVDQLEASQKALKAAAQDNITLIERFQDK